MYQPQDWRIAVGEEQIVKCIDRSERNALEEMKTTIDKLRETRAKYRLSQQTIAEELGIPASEVSQLECFKMKVCRVVSLLGRVRHVIADAANVANRVHRKPMQMFQDPQVE